MSTGDEALVPPTETELHTLLRLSSDVILVVDPDDTCRWSSDDSVTAGRPARDAFVREDGELLEGLLGDVPAGPTWVRRRVEGGSSRWVSAVATPRDGGGWIVLLRAVLALDATQPEGAKEGTRDEVTGVADREQVLNEVAWLLSATPRTGKEIAVAACDLDDFSYVNEEFGRDVGDEVLRVVTERISSALRSGDLVARLDADQFLVVMRGVHHLRGAIRVANKVRAAVEDPITLSAGFLVQTASVGVTLISRGESVDSVLARVQSAKMLAKDSGGNVVMSSPSI